MPEAKKRIIVMRPFAYAADEAGTKQAMAAVGETILLRAGAADALVAEGHAEFDTAAQDLLAAGKITLNEARERVGAPRLSTNDDARVAPPETGPDGQPGADGSVAADEAADSSDASASAALDASAAGGEAGATDGAPGVGAPTPRQGRPVGKRTVGKEAS